LIHLQGVHTELFDTIDDVIEFVMPEKWMQDDDMILQKLFIGIL
jgi:hypothetical protein